MTIEVVPEVWVEDRSWVLLGQYTSLKCRWRSGHPLVKCLNRVVAEVMRGRRRQTWWVYCSDHLYGRRVVDGRVETPVHPDSPAAKRGYC